MSPWAGGVLWHSYKINLVKDAQSSSGRGACAEAATEGKWL